MKNFFRSLLILCLMFLLTTGVFAAEMTTYEIPEFSMTVDIPSDWYCITSQTTPDELGDLADVLDLEAIQQSMPDLYRYMDAMSSDFSMELLITVTETSVLNYDGFSDEALLKIAGNLGRVYEDMNVDRQESIHHGENHNFAVGYMIMNADGETDYVTQYTTTLEFCCIHLSLHTSAPITEEEEALLRQIADSVTVAPSGKNAPRLGPYTHKDPEFGFSVEVPAYWIENSSNMEDNTVFTTFISCLDTQSVITVSVMDIYETLDFGSDIPRTEVDMDELSLGDVALLFAVDEEVMSTRNIDGREFCTYEGFMPDGQTPVTYLIWLEDGCLYVVQAADSSHPEVMDALLSMAASLQVPEIEEPEELPPDPQPEPEALPAEPELDVRDYTYDPAAEARAAVIKGFALTLAIYFLPLLGYRFFIVQEPIPKKKAKKLVIIYGICSFILMSLCLLALELGAASAVTVIIWCWLDYKIITRGAKEEGKPAPLQEPKTNVCPNCGKTNSPEFTYCSDCGTKL